jgi:hypothetical protein
MVEERALVPRLSHRSQAAYRFKVYERKRVQSLFMLQGHVLYLCPLSKIPFVSLINVSIAAFQRVTLVQCLGCTYMLVGIIR